jgi:hypothetical protein
VFYCCASSSCIKLLVLKGHLYNAGERSVSACTTVFVVILTLQGTSAKALAVSPQKDCYEPSSLVHMALWGSAQEHVHWALGHLDTTPATRVRIDTSNARESHANPAAYGGIFRYHATPTSTHGAQEGRFFGALYPGCPTLQSPSYHCGNSQGHARRLGEVS